MRRVLLSLLLFSLSIINVCAQQVSYATVYNVYNKIIDAIGNNNPRAPKLEFVDSESEPASYKSESKIIAIENKALKVCYSLGTDSLNVLSYILAHELGHHYRNHGWMSHYSSFEFSSPLNNQNMSPIQRAVYEVEADIYAGFYSHIAGFDALKVADVFLDSIYNAYAFRPDLENYPTLNERKAIIKKNQTDFDELKTTFDLANSVMAAGYYDYAEELYTNIIDKGFTSREIYNNLGLTYVYEALDMGVEDALFHTIIPFEIDLKTRLETSGTSRSALMPKQNVIALLTDAKKEFERAIDFDNTYCIAKENLLFTEIALDYLEENGKAKANYDDLKSDCNRCFYCIKGHTAAVNNDFNLANKMFRKGAKTCMFCNINSDFNNKQIPKTKKYTTSEFELNKVNGIDMFCKDFKSTDCDLFLEYKKLNICYDTTDGASMIKIKKKIKGRTSCISLQEIDSNDKKWENALGIYNGDDVTNITTRFKDINIFSSGNKKYISIKNERLTFFITDDKVSKWCYFERYD